MNKNIIINGIEYTKAQIDKAYEEGHPLITDALYDKHFGSNVPTEADEELPWEKFKHLYKGCGFSLTKVDLCIQSVFDWSFVQKWFLEHADVNYLLNWKYDGLNINLYYKEGKLYAAVTKGKHGYGYDILRNVLKIKNVKAFIPGFTGVITGEIIISNSVFEKELKALGYENARNAASGLAKKFKGENYSHTMHIIYHGVNPEDTSAFVTEAQKYDFLDSLGLITAQIYKPKPVTTLEEFKKIYNEMLAVREKLDFEADGVVLICNSIKLRNQLGYETSGNPNFAAAIKFPAIECETIIRDIIFQNGKTGKFCPVAKVEPVYIGGVTVTSVTMANINQLNKFTLKLGDRVLISRRGDVIPHLEKNLTPHENYIANVPSHCPLCNAPTIIEGAFLLCTNDDCESVKIGSIKKWVEIIAEKFGFKGLGEARIDEMFDKGLIKDIADLYKLTPEMLINNLTNVQEKSAKNILEFQKFKDWELHVFLGSLNIHDESTSIGKSIFKWIYDAGYKTLDAIYALTPESLNIKGIGKGRKKLILDGIKAKKPLIDKLITECGIRFVKEAASETTKLKGMTFCITGTLSQTRDVFKHLIESNGGKFSKEVNKTLNYLVAGADCGSKLDKAKKFGVKIITEQEFKALLS